MSEAEQVQPLRVAFVPGVVPTKWFRRWNDRMDVPLSEIPHDDPAQLIATGEADMALVRTHAVDSELHEVTLYDEARGIATAKDHVLSVTAEFDEVTPADLAGEVILVTSTDPAEVREMLPVVASGAGVLFAPRPLLRVLGGRGIIDRTISDETASDLPSTAIRLIWSKERDDEVTQEFVGIVKGRRPGSTRGQTSQPDAVAEPVKLTARQKTFAKQARREASSSAAQKKRSGGAGGGKGKAGGVGKRKGGGRKRR